MLTGQHVSRIPREVYKNKLRGQNIHRYLRPQPLKRLPRITYGSVPREPDEPPKTVFKDKETMLDPLYNPKSQISYSDQIFKDRYVLGAGDFGVVYKVRARKNNRKYAVKIFTQRYASRYGYIEVYNHEKIEHPNCVQLIMAWKEKNAIHLLMEYCPMSLAQYSEFAGESFPDSQVWELLYDMSQALRYMHGNNLLHRDVKPANIMMTLSGYYKLADFGLVINMLEVAACKGNTGMKPVSTGDSKYLSLEALACVYTYGCDIFALGISAMEVSTNIDLPSSGWEWELLRKERMPEQFYNKVGRKLASTIERMVAHNYQKRPTAKKLLTFSGLRKVARDDRRKSREIYAIEWQDPEPAYNVYDVPDNSSDESDEGGTSTMEVEDTTDTDDVVLPAHPAVRPKIPKKRLLF